MLEQGTYCGGISARSGFRVIFGPQNGALQIGYGAENIDRSGKCPSKIKMEKRFHFNKMRAVKATFLPPTSMLSASHSGAEPELYHRC